MVQVILKPNRKKDVLNVIKASLEEKKAMLKIAINQTQDILQNFEKKYKMRTDSFYKKFHLGRVGDKIDFIEWAGEKEILDKLEKEYNQIQEIRFAH